jgi:hypothetical protein
VVISRTAYRLNGGSAALAAPLLAIGTLGMLVPMHDAQPAIAAIAGFAIALRGLAVWQQQALRGGRSSASAWASASSPPAATSPPSNWPRPDPDAAFRLAPPRKPQGLAIALGIALALALPWPLLLWQQAPTLFDLWWAAELASLGFAWRPGLNHLEMLAWAAWPVLPLALWALWLERRKPLQAQNFLMLAAAAWALLLFRRRFAQAGHAAAGAGAADLARRRRRRAPAPRRGQRLRLVRHDDLHAGRRPDLAGRHRHADRRTGAGGEELQQAGARLRRRSLTRSSSCWRSPPASPGSPSCCARRARPGAPRRAGASA